MVATSKAQKERNDVLFVRPGDLHLEEADWENHRVAQWMVQEVNDLIRPDFVQFAGDNVQHGKAEQFAMFLKLVDALRCRWEPMVGDHDLEEGGDHAAFQRHCGIPYKSFSLNGTRFVRLNSLEFQPVGFSDRQLDWMETELFRASQLGERVIVFQHHYPFKVMESFEGPGIDRWRKLIQSNAVEAILCGHTHYGQIANDGRNVSIATRSIGDPEGGAGGYHLFYTSPESFACVYREHGAKGPVVMITTPRQEILARNGKQLVVDRFEVEALTLGSGVHEVTCRVDDGVSQVLSARESPRPENASLSAWGLSLPLPVKGVHLLSVSARDEQGNLSEQTIEFRVDPTGRFTPVPAVIPRVTSTQYC